MNLDSYELLALSQLLDRVAQGYKQSDSERQWASDISKKLAGEYARLQNNKLLPPLPPSDLS